MARQTHLQDISILLSMCGIDQCNLQIFDPGHNLTGLANTNHYPKFDASGPSILLTTCDRTIAFRGMDVNDFDAVICVGGKLSATTHTYRTELSVVKDHSKRLRWFQTSGLKTAHFLKFYSVSGWKPALYRSLVKVAYKLGLGQLLHPERITLHTKEALKGLQQAHATTIAGFTGTPGKERKALMYVDSPVPVMVKKAVGQWASKAIKKEIAGLNKVNRTDFPGVQTPELISRSAHELVMRYVPVQSGFNRWKLNKEIAPMVAGFHKASQTVQKVAWTPLWDRLISVVPPSKSGATIINKMAQLVRRLPSNHNISVSHAHGDFTPWNLVKGDSEPILLDWESSESIKPALFDWFHFITQQAILVDHDFSFKSIWNKVQRATASSSIAAVVEKDSIDLELHYCLYICEMVARYVPLYQHQQDLHIQATWQMNVWNQGLTYFEAIYMAHNARTHFIHQFNRYLSKIPHAYVKHWESPMGVQFEGDIDLAVEKQYKSGILQFIEQFPTVSKVRKCNKSFMTIVELFFDDGGFISLDLIHRFERKGNNYMRLEPMLKSRGLSGAGVVTPELRFDMEYMWLFYNLNGAAIPHRYAKTLRVLPKHEQTKVVNYLNTKLDLGVWDLEGLLDHRPELVKIAAAAVQLRIPQKGIVKKVANYILDTIKQMTFSRPKVITLSGVDGAGKSTIIELLKEKLEKTYRRKVVVLRHRPSILPILSSLIHGKSKAEQIAASNLPRQGGNQSTLSSLLRFSYYLTDYVVGRWVVWAKYAMTGHTVIYDRYYFDFISDPKRSNIQLPAWLTKFCFRLVAKPDLNLFLYAHPDVILNRKQELKKEAIVELTSNYQQLFSDYDKRYNAAFASIENNDREDTLKEILKMINNAA